jgi:methionyl-tRNA formyltransferase
MKVIFMGTPDFSVPTLEALVHSEHEVIAVVTQPDKPKGRGKEIQMPPVKETALKYGIPVLQPVRAREESFIQQIRDLNPDVCVVIAFGQILTKEFLDIPRYGCVNIHASLLPKYRGASPIQWSVINGDAETGITTMLMNEGMDTGDMLEKLTVTLDPKETGGSLFDRLSTMGGDLILSALAKLEAGTITRTPQDHSQATYVKKIPKTLGDINWTQPAAQIERLIRGLNPWPSAYTHLNGKMLKLWEADVLPDPSDTPSPVSDALCGTVLFADASGLQIQTGNGILNVTSLQLEGKKRMDIGSFLRGYSIPVGTKLGE